MKPTYFVFLTCLFSSPIAFATEIPGWMTPLTKAHAFETLVEEMKDGPFYRVNEMNTSPVDNAGEKSIRTVVRFEDSRGCESRTLQVECKLGREAELVFCMSTLTDCEGKVEQLGTKQVQRP